MPARKISDSEIEGALAMVEAGQSLAKASRTTGIPRSTIQYHCYKLGVYLPAPPQACRNGPGVNMRNGHAVRPFTAEDDRRMVEMEMAGASRAEIARTLSRARSSVVMRLMILAHREERAFEGEAGAA